MSEPENFLTRWSRRKAEAKDEPVEGVAPAPGDEEPSNGKSAEQVNSDSTAPVRAEAPESEFDISTLPPIDSISASTDVTAFLKSVVPANLARAALRRAWAADPSIRDFVGLSENSWDFTAPDGVPGFGPLSDADAGRLMAQYNETLKEVAGEAKQTLERIGHSFETTNSVSESGPLPLTQKPAEKPNVAPRLPMDEVAQSTGEKNVVQCEIENIATQKNPKAETESSASPRHSHGSALPK